MSLKRRWRPDSSDYEGGKVSRSRPDASVVLPSIEAHEATLIHSQPEIAQRVVMKHTEGTEGGLIRWNTQNTDDSEIWVDRYDARLLLSSLPESQNPRHSIRSKLPASPLADTGWDELPSDSEDTFFFSPREAEDYIVEKRRLDMERNREERMRAISAMEDDPIDERDNWGSSDEEPDEDQMELMQRTATHIQRSPNPAQLEMRILANHGSDPRFAFLRGRWKKAWLRVKAPPSKPIQPASILGGLAEYSGSDDSGDNEEPQPPGPPHQSQTRFDESQNSEGAEADREKRRARAKLWAQKRKENLS